MKNDYIVDNQENFLEDLIDTSEKRREVNVVDGGSYIMLDQAAMDANDPWWKENIKPMAVTLGDYKRLGEEELREKALAVFREVAKVQARYGMDEPSAFERHQAYTKVMFNIH